MPRSAASAGWKPRSFPESCAGSRASVTGLYHGYGRWRGPRCARCPVRCGSCSRYATLSGRHPGRGLRRPGGRPSSCRPGRTRRGCGGRRGWRRLRRLGLRRGRSGPRRRESGIVVPGPPYPDSTATTRPWISLAPHRGTTALAALARYLKRMDVHPRPVWLSPRLARWNAREMCPAVPACYSWVAGAACWSAAPRVASTGDVLATKSRWRHEYVRLTRMCRLPDARNESTPPAKEVHSVGRALDIVEALARSDHELGVSEVAGVTGLAPGTAHRLLATLAYHGYVRQNVATRRYGPGIKLLSVAADAHERIGGIARPFLTRLMQASQETANLAVLEAN